jgi:hypothetical protein
MLECGYVYSGLDFACTGISILSAAMLLLIGLMVDYDRRGMRQNNKASTIAAVAYFLCITSFASGVLLIISTIYISAKCASDTARYSFSIVTIFSSFIPSLISMASLLLLIANFSFFDSFKKLKANISSRNKLILNNLPKLKESDNVPKLAVSKIELSNFERYVPKVEAELVSWGLEAGFIQDNLQHLLDLVPYVAKELEISGLINDIDSFTGKMAQFIRQAFIELNVVGPSEFERPLALAKVTLAIYFGNKRERV